MSGIFSKHGWNTGNNNKNNSCRLHLSIDDRFKLNLVYNRDEVINEILKIIFYSLVINKEKNVLKKVLKRNLLLKEQKSYWRDDAENNSYYFYNYIGTNEAGSYFSVLRILYYDIIKLSFLIGALNDEDRKCLYFKMNDFFSKMKSFNSEKSNFEFFKTLYSKSIYPLNLLDCDFGNKLNPIYLRRVFDDLSKIFTFESVSYNDALVSMDSFSQFLQDNTINCTRVELFCLVNSLGDNHDSILDFKYITQISNSSNAKIISDDDYETIKKIYLSYREKNSSEILPDNSIFGKECFKCVQNVSKTQFCIHEINANGDSFFDSFRKDLKDGKSTVCYSIDTDAGIKYYLKLDFSNRRRVSPILFEKQSSKIFILNFFESLCNLNKQESYKKFISDCVAGAWQKITSCCEKRV